MLGLIDGSIWSEFPSPVVQKFAEATLAHAIPRAKVSSILNGARSPLLQYSSALNEAARLVAGSSNWYPLLLMELGQCYLHLSRPALASACFDESQRWMQAGDIARPISAALLLRARLDPFWNLYLDNFFDRPSQKTLERLEKDLPSETFYLQLAEDLREHEGAASLAFGMVCCELARLNLVLGDAGAARRYAVRAGDETLGPTGQVEVSQILAICDLIDGSPDVARQRLRGLGLAEPPPMKVHVALTHRLVAKSFKAQAMWKDALDHMDEVKDCLSTLNAQYAAKIEVPYFLDKNLHHSIESRGFDPAAQLIQAILLYIDRNLASTLTLSSIATEFGVPAEELASAVQKKLGISVRIMIEERRMVAARTALTSNGVGCYSIREVGENVGIKHPSTFGRRYKHWFKELPAETRKRSA